MYRYRHLSGLITAIRNCEKLGNTEWLDKHATRLHELGTNQAPSGSGLDAGSELVLKESTPDKLVFSTSYHHMSDGMYDGWTKHKVTVRPSLMSDIDVHVSGRNRNDIKEHLQQTFDLWLREEPDRSGE